MNPYSSSESLIAHLKQIQVASATNAVDELLRLRVWTPGSQWHREDVLIYAAGVAASVLEYRLAGLAAYQAQRLHMNASGQQPIWGLPMLPGLEKLPKNYNLVRHVPLRSRNILLRKPNVSDRAFLLHLFGDSEFARQYSRPAQSAREWIAYSLIESAQRCPGPSDPWAWIVCDRNEQPIGIVELSLPDFYQGSVDLSVGLMRSAQGSLGAEACTLGACIAFHHLNLSRITWHVYGDNARPHDIAHRLGMREEYSLEHMVRDMETGEHVRLTTYSMLREEFRHWPITQRVFKRLLPDSAPDLLHEYGVGLAEQITGEQTSWNQFPPKAPTYISAPEVPVSQPGLTAVSLPGEIRGKRVTLRQPTQDDDSLVQQWFKTNDFLKCYPRRLKITDDWQKTRENILSAETNLRIWIVERASSDPGPSQTLGLIGLERQSPSPVLFIVAGFSREAGLYSVVESWRLVDATIEKTLPNHQLYIKTPCTMGARKSYRSCGIERHFRLASGEYTELEIFQKLPL